MSVLRVITWNVLHQVHAINWKEAIVDPADARVRSQERAARILDKVAGWRADGADLICLQEVSGDQVTALRARIGPSFVFDHCYPRVPKLRDGAPSPLADPREHLVVITREAGARPLLARTFDDDRGKGFLAVELASGAIAIATHLSWRRRGRAQLEILAAYARSLGKPTILAGDFNAEIETLTAGLRDLFSISDVVGQVPSRIDDGTGAGHTIDHVISLGGMIETSTVLDADGLSDHHPVAATVRLP